MREQINPILLPYTSDPAVFALLDASVGRILRREGDATSIDKERLRHIADWLRAALVNDEPWLKNVDEHSRPKKLLKFGSIAAVAREADKAMLKAAQRLKGVKLVEGDEELVEMLEDGYYVLRLLTPAALDRESAQMQHCIGNGAYDDSLKHKNRQYLSLRDPQGKAHATIEVRNGRIIQLQGKQNAPPITKYLDALSPYIRSSGLGVDVPASHLGHVIDVDGVWHPLDNLPEGLTVEGWLDLGGTEIARLPKGLKVSGHLNLAFTPIKTLPEGLSVGGDLYLNNTLITALPEGLTIGGDLCLDHTRIAELPDDLSVGRDLSLSFTKVTTLPKGLTVCRDLRVNNTKITSLPEGLTVVGNLVLSDTPIRALPDDLRVGYDLTLNDTAIEKLPKGLTVNGHLDLRRTPITNLPEGLTVKRDLHLHYAPIKTLPEGLAVGGRLSLYKTSITSLPDSIDDDTTVHCNYGTMTAKEFRTRMTTNWPSLFNKAMNLIFSKLTEVPQVLMPTRARRHER